MDRCAVLLRQGVSLLIFPEGTRKIDEAAGPIGGFKAGAFRLALDCGVPLQPVTISGARHMMPARGYPYLAFGTVRMTIHPHVPTSGRSVEELMEAVRPVLASGLRPCDLTGSAEPGSKAAGEGAALKGD